MSNKLSVLYICGYICFYKFRRSMCVYRVKTKSLSLQVILIPYRTHWNLIPSLEVRGSEPFLLIGVHARCQLILYLLWTESGCFLEMVDSVNNARITDPLSSGCCVSPYGAERLQPPKWERDLLRQSFKKNLPTAGFVSKNINEIQHFEFSS